MIDIKKIISEARRGRPSKTASSDEEGGREHIVVQLRKVENLRGEKHVEFNDNSKHKIPLEHVKKALNMHQGMKPIQKGEFEKRLATSHSSFMSAVKGEPAPAAKPKVTLASMKREEVEVVESKAKSSDPKPKLYSDVMKKATKFKDSDVSRMIRDEKARKAAEMKKEGWVHIGPPGAKSPYDRFGDKLKGTITLGDDSKDRKKDKEAPSSGTSKVVNDRLTVRKEAVNDVDPTTSRSDRGNYKTYVTVGQDGRVKLVKRREHHKEVKVESVSVNMQQDSLDKLKKEPQASPKDLKSLPPTQGNKPIGGEEQVHAGKFSVAEENILNTLYNSLNEQNKQKFDQLKQTEEGLNKLLNFAYDQGII